MNSGLDSSGHQQELSGGLPDQQYSILGVAIVSSEIQADGNAIISNLGNTEVYTQVKIEDLATAS